MRVEKICYNCSFSTLQKEKIKCPICNIDLKSVGFLTGRKLANMNGTQRREWVEAEIGHPIAEETKTKYNNYCKTGLKETLDMLEKERIERENKAFLERQSKNLARMQKESDKLNHTPKCPICGSSNIKKITITKRAVKTATFGVLGAVDDAGKTWQCNNCGSKF